MAKLEPVCGDSFMKSRKRKGNIQLTCRGVPLPYLIRPRRTLPPIDTFGFYNDYLEDLWDDEGDSSMEAVETSSLVEGNEGIARGHLLSDEKDEDYVVVDHVEAMPNSQKERAGAIQMMELSKDTADESDSDDAGSSSDEWVVV